MTEFTMMGVASNRQHRDQMMAATQAEEKQIRTLCEKGEYENLVNNVPSAKLRHGLKPENTQPIHYFAAKGNLEEVRELVEEYKCDPNCINYYGVTPLHCASFCGRFTVVKYLINKHKCKVSVRDIEGETPLAYVSYCVRVADKYIPRPLDVFQEHNKPHIDHIHTAKFLLCLMTFQVRNVYVSFKKELDVLKLPLYCGSFGDFKQIKSTLSLKLRDNISYSVARCLGIALEQKKSSFIRNILHTYAQCLKELTPNNPFYKACSIADLNVIKLFLELNICKPDAHSVSLAIERNHYELVQFLLQSADHPLLLDKLTSRTSLLSYIFNHDKLDEKLIKLVLDRTLSVDVRDGDGNTPLHLLCNESRDIFTRSDSVSIPDEYSCYQSVLNSKCELPVHIACKTIQDLNLIKRVSSHLSEDLMNTQDSQGNTPLHIVCKDDNMHYSYYKKVIEYLKYLIHEKKCSINTTNNVRELPLHTFLNRLKDYSYSRPDDYCMAIIQLIANSDLRAFNVQDVNGNTPLHIACEIGDPQIVLYLISKFKLDFNITNSQGCLPLHCSLISRNMSLDVVRAVSIYMDSTMKCKRNDAGKTPLHIACERMRDYGYCYSNNRYREKKLLLDLISDKASVDIQDNNGDVPLHTACKNGDFYTVEYLTSKFNCNLDLLNHEHCLPLHYAVTSSYSLDLVKSVSGSTCTLIHLQNSDGMTPLHLACKNGDVEVVKYLAFEKACFPSCFQHSSDIYDTLKIHVACRDSFDFGLLRSLANERNVNNRNHRDETPLHIACESDNILAVRLLVGLNSDTVLCKDFNRRFPFHTACSKSLKYVEAMLPYITDEMVNACDDASDTPLHIAFKNNKADIVESLLTRFKCDVSIQSSKRESLMHLACKTTLDIVKIVVKMSTEQSISISESINCQSESGNTPLHIACKQKVLDIVQYLTNSFNCEPSMRLRNNESKLPVDFACEHSLEMVKLVCQPCTVEDLVSRHMYDDKILMALAVLSSPEIYNELFVNQNITTLDRACMCGSLNTVKYLVKEKGCTLSALKDNHSALGYACGFKCGFYKTELRPEIVQFLVNECGYDPGKSIRGKFLFQYCCQINNLELVKALTVCRLDYTDSQGDTLLHCACKNDCLDIVHFLVNRGCDQNTINNKGESALHIACRNSLKLTKLLTNSDVNLKNAYGHTPLHIACECEQEDIVQYFVEDVNCDVKVRNNKGEYALHIASLCSVRIRSLVQKSDINCQDNYGNTPLHNACYVRDIDMIEFLLSFPESRADIINEDGDLALHVYLNKYQTSRARGSLLTRNMFNRFKRKVMTPQIVEMILKGYTGATVITNQGGFTPIDMTIMDGNLKVLKVLLSIGEIDDIVRETLLHSACECGHSEIVHWLLDNGLSTDVLNDKEEYPQHSCFRSYACLDILKQLGSIEVCRQDKDGNTILHLACRIAHSEEDILQYILRTFDNCKTAFSIQNVSKETPLHLLASSIFISSETLLLVQCDNPNLQDRSGNTSLHLACQYAFHELAEHLVTKCKCNPNLTNDKGELPLHIAVAQSQLKITELLVSPENVNKCNVNGDTPLHIACQRDKLDLIKLVGTTDNVNMQNSDGDTPLHLACQGEHLNNALYLLKDLKCSVEYRNKESETAFHVLFNNMNYHGFSSNELNRSLLLYIPQHLSDMTNKTGDTILHIACQKTNYFYVVFYLVETLGYKTDVINELSGATLLHFACDHYSLSVIHLVKQCNPLAQIRDISYIPKEFSFVTGDTPLHVACRKGNIDVIKVLLECGHTQALNCPNILKELPIHLAVAANPSLELLETFIEHKEHFDCNTTDINGDTALHIMCKQKPINYDLVLYTTDKLKCKLDIRNNDGNLPLHIACQNKHICNSVIELICDAVSSTEIKHRNKNGNTALHEFLRCKHIPEYDTKHFRSLVRIFVIRGFLPIESDKDQLLSYVLLACRFQGLKIVNFLSKKYQSLSMEPPISVLHEACLNTNVGVLQYVLKTFEHAFDVNTPNSNGDLPLHLASRMKVCKESTILLIKKTRDVNYKNNQGETPLHEVYNTDRNSYIQSEILLVFLKSKDIDVLAQNEKGSTPLHGMCKAGKFDDLVTVLRLKKEIDANIRDESGRTILHFVSQANDFGIIEFLLTSTNADPSIEDDHKQTPITLTTDPIIIKLLLEHGADPQPLAAMHKDFFETFSCEKPPPTPVKLLVIGYPSVGKTTLIQSLQNELSDEVISEHFDHTAGIVTTKFNSQHYGDVTFYDFAGQAEYYASHDAVLHSTIKNVPPIVLILVNLNESTKNILSQTKYWINLMANRCSGLENEAAHLILVGSHADVLENQGRSPSEKVTKLFQSVAVQAKMYNILPKGVVYLNCTKSKSSEMSQLRQLLQQSTNDLREKGVMSFNAHCFYVFLLHMFKNSNVVVFGRILSALKSKSNDPINDPLFALPSKLPKIMELCHDLNEKGHIMFIEHPTVINMSWLILDKAPLLHEILGTLFSPTDFPQHRPLSYSTGVVPFSRFKEHFSTKHSYPPTLSLAFLSRMEYCREIKDPVVLESIIKEDEFSDSERYFFFPNLVSLERPTDKWSNGTNSRFIYNSGWLIQCKAEGECFNPHFVQALLLRLAFSFTPKKEEDSENDLEILDDSSESEGDECDIKHVVIKRLCSVWKNGIYWMEASGVKTVVEIIDQNTLVLLMQCLQGCELELVKRRSSIISMVLYAKDEFCSKSTLREYFIHPKVVTHPLPKLRDIQRFLFSFQQVKKNIVENNPYVINDQNEHITLRELLYFEPFSELNRDITIQPTQKLMCEEQMSIFNGRNPPQGYDKQLLPSTIPRLHQLDLTEGNGKVVRVIRATAAKWKQFATRLYLEYDDISRIELDNHFQCQNSCRQVCCEWLSGEFRKPVTWATVVVALKEMDLGETAKDLEVIIADVSV